MFTFRSAHSFPNPEFSACTVLPTLPFLSLMGLTTVIARHWQAFGLVHWDFTTGVFGRDSSQKVDRTIL